MKVSTATILTLLLTIIQIFAQQSSVAPGPKGAPVAADELLAAAVNRPQPEYPALAKASRISGKVEIEVVVDPQGKVREARAVSGHPLLKDAAIAIAREWTFDRSKISVAGPSIVGIITFVFDLDQEGGRLRQGVLNPGQWERYLKICRDELTNPTADPKRIDIALARLAASVHNVNTIDEALAVFEEAARLNRATDQMKPYRAQLLLERYYFATQLLDEKQNSEQQSYEAQLSSLSERFVLPAQQLFLQSYADESRQQRPDVRKLVDLGWRVAKSYETLGQQDAATEWLKSMLSYERLPDTKRAEIAYYLAVRLWQKCYDATSKYIIKGDPVPELQFPLLSQWISEAFSNIQLAQELDPNYANAWYYEKLICLEELKLGPVSERRSALTLRAMQAQDHYLELQKKQQERGYQNDPSSSANKPYDSGLPSLNFSSFPTLGPLPPPPPPPPPNSRNSANKT